MTDQPLPEPPASRAATIAKQVGIVLLGFVLAGVMVGLGLWQLGVYNAQGERQAAARAAAPPVALESVAKPGQEVSNDAYARQVRFTGTYDPKLQTLISTGSGDSYRVLTGLRLPGGGILPVVRGKITGRGQAPAPPTGQLTGTGLLMPSEGSDTNSRPGAEPTTVVLPSLTQTWNGLLINGFVTLNAAESRAQSLEPVTVVLPSSHGRLRNGFYALQWWVFAGFAIWMGIRMARDLGRNPDGAMGPDPDSPDLDPDEDPGGTMVRDPDTGESNPPEPVMSSRPRTHSDDSSADDTTT
ncbi:MAG: SURF1 family protein [Microlunatus sp.]|nr:SURF1 family protein [Microlunatus sp.]